MIYIHIHTCMHVIYMGHTHKTLHQIEPHQTTPRHATLTYPTLVHIKLHHTNTLPHHGTPRQHATLGHTKKGNTTPKHSAEQQQLNSSSWNQGLASRVLARQAREFQKCQDSIERSLQEQPSHESGRLLSVY